MDDKDKRIVQMLMDDGRTKLGVISKKLGLPITTVHNRLRRLLSTGAIKIRAELDRKKLGYDIDAYVLLNIDSSGKNIDQPKVIEKITRIPRVLSAAIVTGSKDIVVRLTARSIDELRQTVIKSLRDIEGVASTETLVVLQENHGDQKKLL